MACAIAALAVGLHLLLAMFWGTAGDDESDVQDLLITIGVPVLFGGVALSYAVKAWRLFRIRDWTAAKPEMAGQFEAIAGNTGRMHGIQTEQKAVRKLNLPAGWTKEANVPIPTGDVDLLLVSPHNVAYVVEIKSWAGLRRKWRLSGSVLVKNNGVEPDSDPVAQVMQEVRGLSAHRRFADVVPVIWVPNGRRWRFRHEGVLIINGGTGRLKRAVGAGWF